MTEHIKITGASPIVQYLADGNAAVYWFVFQIFQDADLEVYLDEVRQLSGFTIEGAGETGGGSVTFQTPPAENTIITLRRALVIERTTDFQDSGEFRAKAINDELDYQTAALQDVAAAWTRAVRTSILGPTALDLTITGTAAELNGKFVRFQDADGTLKATAANPPSEPGRQEVTDVSGTLVYDRKFHLGQVLRTSGPSPVIDAASEAELEAGDWFAVRQTDANPPVMTLPAGATTNGTPAWAVANDTVYVHCVDATAGAYVFDLYGTVS